MQSTRFRDVVITELNENQRLVISCDSCGGVGEKAYDQLKVSPYFTGRYTARVTMMEVLCVGAKLIAISNGVSNEMHPTGKEILKGIEDELSFANFSDVIITGSSEENMETLCTGVGMTAIGVAYKDNLLTKKPISGDLALVIGHPKVGAEVVLGTDKDIVSYSDISKLLDSGYVSQIIPIGSKGILYEASSIGDFLLYDTSVTNLEKSAGPSTCVLVVIPPDKIDSVRQMIDTQSEIIGRYS